AHELDFADGLETLRRHADAEPADQELGERRVDHAPGAEALLQTNGGAEHAAVDTDVLPENDDVGVLLHGAGEREIDRLDQRELRHRALRGAPPAGRRRFAAARRRDDRTSSPARAARTPDSARSPPRSLSGTRPQALPPAPCPTPFGSRDKRVAARSALLSSAPAPLRGGGNARHRRPWCGRSAGR